MKNESIRVQNILRFHSLLSFHIFDIPVILKSLSNYLHRYKQSKYFVIVMDYKCLLCRIIFYWQIL